MITYCQQLILTFINFFLQDLLLSTAGILRTIVRSQGWTARQTDPYVCANNCEYSGLDGELCSPIHPDPIRTKIRTRCWKPNSSPMEARSTPDPARLAARLRTIIRIPIPIPMLSSPVHRNCSVSLCQTAASAVPIIPIFNYFCLSSLGVYG